LLSGLMPSKVCMCGILKYRERILSVFMSITASGEDQIVF
jgi:hypothetical protein